MAAPAVTYKLVLGSSSRWRRRVLDGTGLPYSVAVADIDEDAVTVDGGAREDRPRSDPAALSLAIARAKAAAIVPRFTATGTPTLVITADQVMLYQGRIREKPRDAAECRAFATSYTDEPATTISSVVVTNTATGRQAVGTDVARQYIHPLPDAVVEQLMQDPLLMSTCGALRVESEVLKPFLGRREGTEDSIMGLPIQLLYRLLDEALEGQPHASAIVA